MKKIIILTMVIVLAACNTEYPIDTAITEIEVQAGSEFDPVDYFTFENQNGEDISDQITYEGQIDTKTLGDYKIKIKVEIDKKLYTKHIVVHVVDKTPPLLELTSPYFYSIRGTEFNPLNAIVSLKDNYDFDLTLDQIEIMEESIGSSHILNETVDVPTHKMAFTVKDRLGNETVEELIGFEVYPVRYINNSPYTLEQYVQPIYDKAYTLGYQISILRPFDYSVTVVMTVEEAISALENHQGEKIMSLYTDDINSINGIALFLGK